VVVALACGAAMLLLISANQSKALFALAIQALGWASWTSGVTFGLSCAAPPRSQTASATQTLVLQRGFPSRGLAHAELAANTLRLALLVGVPGVALGLLSIPAAPSLLGAVSRVLACFGMAGYALLFGVTVAVLARAARAFAPNYSRLAFAGFILVPLALSAIDPGIPSIPGLLDVLREHLLAAGIGG